VIKMFILPNWGKQLLVVHETNFFVDKNISELLYNLSEKLLDSNSSD